MVRATRRKPLYVNPNAKVWTIDEDHYLVMNTDVSLEELAVTMKCTEDEVSDRRAVLGLIQRARAIIRLKECE